MDKKEKEKNDLKDIYLKYIQDVVSNVSKDLEPSKIAGIFVKKRENINSLIIEAIKIRDSFSDNFIKVNDLGNEIDFLPSNENYDLLVETDGVLVEVLRLYSQEKYDECEEQLIEVIKKTKPIVKKLWIDLCTYKLNLSIIKLHKSIFAKTVNRVPFRDNMMN